MITSLILGGLTGTETGLLGSNRAPWSNTPAAVTCWGGYPAGFTCGGCWAEVIRIQPYDSSQPHAQCIGYESLSGNKPGTCWPHIWKMHVQNLMPCREMWSKASTEAWSINSKFSFLKSSIVIISQQSAVAVFLLKHSRAAPHNIPYPKTVQQLLTCLSIINN